MALATPRSRSVAPATPSCAAVTAEKLPSVTSERPTMTTASTGTSDSVRPPAHSSRPPSATARQPWRSARRPASGPAAPMTHSTKTSPMSAGESENGGRSRRKSMYEKTPMKEKKSPAPVRQAAMSARLASSRRRVAIDSPADGGPGVSGGSERQRGHRAQRHAPARGRRQQRDPDAADEPAEDERRHVHAHGPRADALVEGLGHVGDPDGEQPRHTEPLRGAHGQQDREARRQ